MTSPSDPDLDFGQTLRGFSPGQRLFDRYTLKEILGRGGMGVVWRAVDEQLERDVALKFLPELVTFDEQAVKDLKRETKKSQELRHHHIIQVYDFLSDKRYACISMEYVDGPTLSAFKARGNKGFFEVEEIRPWIQQLCEALTYAHERARVVHRDLKPSNLMLNSKGDLKVADFGIARSLTESVSMITMQRSTSGTLIYMSPQQLDGERATPLDDIYSLGASVYELLTSKPPFYSGSIDYQIREKIPVPMMQRRSELEIKGQEIDPVWEEIIHRCLAKDPAQRPQSVREVAKKLFAPSAQQTLIAKRASRVESPEPRRKLAGLGIAAAVVAVLAVGGLIFFQTVIRNPAKTSVPIQTRSPLPQTVPMNPAPQVGSAIINTSPSGATVTLDGKQQVSPATFTQLKPGKYPVKIELSGYQSVDQEVEVLANEATEFGIITLKPNKPAETVSAGPKVNSNNVYTGTIHARGESSSLVPVSITFQPDLKSGTITESGHRGDAIIKFTGIWNDSSFHAVTGDPVSVPKGITWPPESFTLRFADDGKSATYECTSQGKNYVADLTAQTISASAAKLSSIYKGTITGGTQLTITFGADRKSGTMTEATKTAEVVVRFNGFWDGPILRAVTSDVVSKSAKGKWDPESFTLRFSEDGRSGSYECTADGKYYSAQLSVP